MVTKSQNIVTSSTPIQISWLLHENDLPQQQQKIPLDSQEELLNIKSALFGLCQAPGKQLKKSRNGVIFERDLQTDIKNFKINYNVSLIVCLLNKFELRTLGIDLDKYQLYCTKNEITFLFYPIIEMSTPEETIEQFDKNFVTQIVENFLFQKKVCICHCRGGIGRSGLVGACILLKIQAIKSEKIKFTKIVEYIRKKRDKRCIESQKQMDFVKKYAQFIFKAI